MTNEQIGGFGCGCVSLFLGVALSVWFFGWTTENSFNDDYVQIESLRADAAVVSADRSEDVVGQVTQWNQRIESNKYNNTLPVIGFFVSDRWDDVDKIEIPQ